MDDLIEELVHVPAVAEGAEVSGSQEALHSVGAVSSSPQDAAPVLGQVYLPSTGTSVGVFEVLIEPTYGRTVEIGTPVTAETEEGLVIGVVVDMRTVGSARDPIQADLTGAYDSSLISRNQYVRVATVQVFHAPLMRPVGSGTVRGATAQELLQATGHDTMRWPVPAGVVPTADGGVAKICFDGHGLLGPESAHLMIGGLSGSAKTSYAMVLLHAAIAAGSPEKESVAAVVFNVKGEDLIGLDQEPYEGEELQESDLAMYEALGLTPGPFKDVTVFSPGMPGNDGAVRSPRTDATPLRWDLLQIWPYLKYFFPSMYDDEKLISFLSDFREAHIDTFAAGRAIHTFKKLEEWFQVKLDGPADEDGPGRENPYAWRTHHRATMGRIRRMLLGLQSRCMGLLTRDPSNPDEDIAVTGWRHGQVIVVDLAGLHTDVQAMVIARTCEKLLKSAEDGELGVDHLVVFADEANAFAPASGSEMSAVRRILQRVASQGRYAGLSLWAAGQKLSKVDEMVRDNAATRALGKSADAELTSGTYGRLSGGTSERIATLPRGQMALWHASFRSVLVVQFPRPAWRTGRARTSGAQNTVTRAKVTDLLALNPKRLAKLTEGLSPEQVEQVIVVADDATRARQMLEEARVVDHRKVTLHAAPVVHPDDPFAIDGP